MRKRNPIQKVRVGDVTIEGRPGKLPGVDVSGFSDRQKAKDYLRIAWERRGLSLRGGLRVELDAIMGSVRMSATLATRIIDVASKMRGLFKKTHTAHPTAKDFYMGGVRRTRLNPTRSAVSKAGQLLANLRHAKKNGLDTAKYMRQIQSMAQNPDLSPTMRKKFERMSAKPLRRNSRRRYKKKYQKAQRQYRRAMDAKYEHVKKRTFGPTWEQALAREDRAEHAVSAARRRMTEASARKRYAKRLRQDRKTTSMPTWFDEKIKRMSRKTRRAYYRGRRK